jgi:hypothetical protein
MLLPYFHKKNQKRIAWMVFYALLLQMGTSNTAHALTSGPVQPEAHGFEPVGTTDMVDPFTGDFVYNIPLLDVEGYPINIAYHGGVGLDQEASWVGLGWNITPGAVNRAVRGLPDDFDGETIAKEINIKKDKTLKLSLGAGLEVFGFQKAIKANLAGDACLILNNYRGVSMDFSANAGAQLNSGPYTVSLNSGVSVGSQTGAAINYNASFGSKITDIFGKANYGVFNFNTNGVYNSRNGLHRSNGFSLSFQHELMLNGKKRTTGLGALGSQVPIGLQNYTSVISNASYMNSFSGQIKIGPTFTGAYTFVKAAAAYYETKFMPNGDLSAYGFLNLHHANPSSLLDFSREKDMQWNSTMHYLPQSTLTYDLYNVSGQGTGGSFRPFRNDIGSVFDPNLNQQRINNYNLDLEFGYLNIMELGADAKAVLTTSKVGPWDPYYRKFTGPRTGEYEDVYFKQGGELTENNETYINHSSGNTSLITPDDAMKLPLEKVGSSKRVVRSNYIYPISGRGLDTSLLLDGKSLYSFNNSGFANFPIVNKEVIKRVDDASQAFGRKEHHITEIVQVQKDGRKYVYGLPVVNNVQREAVFAIDNNNADSFTKSTNLINYQKDIDDNKSNSNGLDNYYSSTVTPTYTTANLLTGVLSNDYIDVTGDGISDDDLGSFTKFNYTRKSKDYRWRSPSQVNKANYIPGYFSDKKDDKAAYMIGSREQWYLHSIETKNYVAEFYVSVREDAQGVLDAILGSSSTATYTDPVYKALNTAGDNKSYKLDSIVLYNKHDRFANGASAKSIKTVYFTYDYSLCQGVPNSSSGKLTLKAIRFKYADSKLNVSAPYKFTYTNNYAYNPVAKDRWDMYKPNLAGIGNTLFPFTEQSNATNEYAKAWSLSEINLPSGGVIKVDYESDDYAYVQDKRAMEMFKVDGFGNSKDFVASNQLYTASTTPNLYIYFKRRKTDENIYLSFKDNYLRESSLLYYNVPVQLKNYVYETIKGYATIKEIGACSDSVHGYLKMESKNLENSAGVTNPIVYTALNTGRYNLPHILFDGQDPNEGDMHNILAGLGQSFTELFKIFKNPLRYYLQESYANRADISNGFIRLNTPGLKKKGGGQRVKVIYFYDNWEAMTQGNTAVYGKAYDYTMLDEDGKSIISSGVASWEPSAGGDENPHRVPVSYQVQQGVSFPPNDPVELYQEDPIGESFFPSAVVGYSKVRVRSLHFDQGRSSQYEDLHYFYTAKDFPVVTKATPIANINSSINLLLYSKFDQKVKQGFSFVFNDMHGKPMNSEHWVVKKDSVRELVSFQKQEYFTSAGKLNNTVPTYVSNPQQGTITITNKLLGVETDVTLDSRENKEQSNTINIQANLNIFSLVPPIPIVVNTIIPSYNYCERDFKATTVTKITQQYGILSKVINYSQGANTELHNEVFDPKTGAVLVSSINNEFGDKQYTANYPAYWAYKELGPVYENQNIWDNLSNPLKIDTLGAFANRLRSYNTDFSTAINLPSNMPVGLTIVDEQMPKFGLGDEILLYLSGLLLPPTRVWVMGYTSDNSNCYVVLAPREPYNLPADTAGKWSFGNILNPVTSTNHLPYRIVKSGRSNRTTETIQSLTTIDKNNLIPSLKNDFSNLISIQAQRFSHSINQVCAANTTSDSLNPYVTGKIGLYRPEMELINIKKRNYASGLNRNAGLFDSKSYWQIEKDSFNSYCPEKTITVLDSTLHTFSNVCYHNATCMQFYIQRIAGDLIQFNFISSGHCCGNLNNSTTQQLYPPAFNFHTYNEYACMPSSYQYPYSSINGVSSTCNVSATFNDSLLINASNTYHTCYTGMSSRPAGLQLDITNPFTNEVGTFYITFDGTNFRCVREGYNNRVCINGWSARDQNCSQTQTHSTSTTNSYWTYFLNTVQLPYRVNKKIELGIVGHSSVSENENWIAPQRSTLYNATGNEIENKDLGLGYNAAIYGYNQQLPICVAKNARHSEVLYDGFEDYNLLQSIPSKRANYLRLNYSPFAPFFTSTLNLSTGFKKSTLQGNFLNANVLLTQEDAHSGLYALKVNSGTATVPLNGSGSAMAQNYSFKLKVPLAVNDSEKLVVSLWLKPIGTTTFNTLNYGTTIAAVVNIDSTQAALSNPPYFPLIAKTSIIDGWQQYEVLLTTKYDSQLGLLLPSGYYYDDIRITPYSANSKAFVYDPFTWKLMTTLDENNFATFYEYDAEGNLIRTKKETEKGIITLSETRNTHKKN